MKNPVLQAKKAIDKRRKQEMGSTPGNYQELPYFFTPDLITSDERSHIAELKVLQCFKRSEFHKEGMFVIFNMKFSDLPIARHLSDRELKRTAAKQLKLPVSQINQSILAAFKALLLPKDLQHLQHMRLDKGDIDILLMHHQYGLLAGSMKIVAGSDPQSVAKEVEESIKQLDKSDVMLRYSTSADPLSHQPSPRIVKTLILPNVSKKELQSVVDMNPTLAEVSFHRSFFDDM
jgi:hypothetical protein